MVPITAKRFAYVVRETADPSANIHETFVVRGAAENLRLPVGKICAIRLSEAVPSLFSAHAKNWYRSMGNFSRVEIMFAHTDEVGEAMTLFMLSGVTGEFDAMTAVNTTTETRGQPSSSRSASATERTPRRHLR